MSQRGNWWAGEMAGLLLRDFAMHLIVLAKRPAVSKK